MARLASPPLFVALHAPAICRWPTPPAPRPRGVYTVGNYSLDCFDQFTAKFIRSKVGQIIGRAGFKEADRQDLTAGFVLDTFSAERVSIRTWRHGRHSSSLSARTAL